MVTIEWLTHAKGMWFESGSGADPGIFIRGGGPTFPKILTSKKKKKKKNREEEERKTEGCSGSLSADIWYKSIFQTIIYIQVYFRFFFFWGGGGLLYNFKPLST